MKLLFDHNLAPKLVERLSDIFPLSEHVYRIRLDEAADIAICQYARAHDFAAVTKDADYELIALRPDAPSIVWIRRGNCSTHQVETVTQRTCRPNSGLWFA